MKLTKLETKRHTLAVELLHSHEPGQHDRTYLPDPDDHEPNRWGEEPTITATEYIYRYWHPGAEHNLGVSGAFFTPVPYAWSIAQSDGCDGATLEPTAGIGVVAWSVQRWSKPRRLVCIELNPAYCAVGRRLLPEAEWHCGDVFDILPRLGRFDSAVGNPPYGRVAGGHGVFHLELASLLTRHAQVGATLLVPESFCSNEGTRNGGPDREDEHYRTFCERHPGWGISPTAFEAPTQFRGCTLRTAIVNLWHEPVVEESTQAPALELPPILEVSEPTGQLVLL